MARFRWLVLIGWPLFALVGCGGGGLDYPSGTPDGTRDYFDDMLVMLEATEPAVSSENAQACMQRVLDRLIDDDGVLSTAPHDKAVAESILARCVSRARFR